MGDRRSGWVDVWRTDFHNGRKVPGFSGLDIYISTLGALFSPYLAQTLDVTLPFLRFYFHKNHGPFKFLAVSSNFFQLTTFPPNAGLSPSSSPAASKVTHSRIEWSPRFLQLTNCTASNTTPSAILASLCKYFPDSSRVVGTSKALSQQFHEGIVEVTKRHLQFFTDKRRVRAARAVSHAG